MQAHKVLINGLQQLLSFAAATSYHFPFQGELMNPNQNGRNLSIFDIMKH